MYFVTYFALAILTVKRLKYPYANLTDTIPDH